MYCTGLPTDITIDEIVEFFKKCGVIAKDLETGTHKVRLYTDQQGKQKGDCRVGYENYESTDLALEILNG